MTLATAASIVTPAAGAGACQSDGREPDYQIVRQLPHDTAAFTQGLLFADGVLYESTGRLGRSAVRRVDPATGRVLASAALPADRFGEGLALLDGRLYQLTWQHGVGYVYNVATLARVDSFRYAGEGWGLTSDGHLLIMSDGSATLRFLDRVSFRVVREVTVQDDGNPVTQLNELEYVRGSIYANVYQSDWIVQIDPSTGEVRQRIDLRGLLPPRLRTRDTDVLNGIAFDERTGRFFLTGKLWPAVFEVRLAGTPRPR